MLANLSPRACLADLVRQIDGEVEQMRPYSGYRAEDIVRDQIGAGLTRSAQGPVINIMPFAYCFDFGGCRVVSAHQLTVGVPRELSPHWEGLNDQLRSLVRIVPAWTVVLFTVVCLVVMYSG